MGVRNYGIDLEASPEQCVVAARSGKISVFEEVPGFGKVVLLEHTDGTVTFYGHLARVLAPHGRWIRQGEPLAVAGSTGDLARGTELHFRVMRNEKYVDPLQSLPR